VKKLDFIEEKDVYGIKDEYYDEKLCRFKYLKEVIDQVKSLDNINTTLELGPYKSPLIKRGDVIDITDEYLEYYPIEIGNFYKHDCTVTPYPFEEKKYDLVVACQVLEHLGSSQSRVFKEFARISKMAIITLPYKWNLPGFPSHHMIDEKIIDKWTNGLKPLFQKIVDSRILLIYRFGDDPSLKNIKKQEFKKQEHANFQLTEDLNKEKKKRENLEKRLKQTENQLKDAQNLLRISKHPIQQRQIKESKNQLTQKHQFKDLNQKIDNLTAHFYEIGYLNNNHRSIIKRLISKFPYLYILFCRKNNGIKNTLINIKGYRAIKKNHLLDTGYYLKSNGDVRLSGVDPILHYIYHGYKEHRKPNPQFDGDYYLKEHIAVKCSNINPLVYYALYGEKEGRKTKFSKSVK